MQAKAERRRSQFFSNLGLSRSPKNGPVEKSSSDVQGLPPLTPTRTRSQGRGSTKSQKPRNIDVDLGILQYGTRDGVSQDTICLAIDSTIQQLRTRVFDTERISKTISCAKSLIQDESTIKSAYGLLGVLLADQNVLTSRRTEVLLFVQTLRGDQHVVLRPILFNKALVGGRDVDGMEQIVLQLLTQLASDCFNLHRKRTDLASAEHTTAASKTTTDQADDSVEKSYHLSLDLIADTIKFGGSSLDASGIDDLVVKIHSFARSSTTQMDMRSLLRIVNSLITYLTVPRRSLRDVICILCLLQYRSKASGQLDMGQSSWQTFTWLLETHLSDLCINTLLETVEQRSDSSELSLEEADGALQLLGKILSGHRDASDFTIDLERLIESFIHPNAGTPRLPLETELSIVELLVSKDHLRSKLVETPDWQVFTSAFVWLSARIDDAAGTGGRERLNQLLREVEQMSGLSEAQKDALIMLFLELAPSLPDDLADRLLSSVDSRLDSPSFEDEMKHIMDGLILGQGTGLATRIRAMDLLEGLCLEGQWRDPIKGRFCLSLVLDAIASGDLAMDLQAKLVECVLQYEAQVGDDDDCFYSMVDSMSKAIRRCSAPASKDPASAKEPPAFLHSSKHAASGLVVLFMRSINRSAKRSQDLYARIMELSRDVYDDPAACVMLLRGMFRLRSDVNHRIFLVVSPEGEGLAATLCRTSDTPSADDRRMSKTSGHSTSGPVWMYGEIRGLPEDPPSAVSPMLYSNSQGSAELTINLADWMRHILVMLTEGCEWEQYSYICVHIGAQISNRSLLTEAIPQIQELRRLLCKQLLGQSFQKPPESSDLKQADVAVCLYHILTMLIGYHEHFSRAETEEMISAFIMGLTAWDRTTVPCLHALTLCCYELPESLKRDLVRIVSQMATIVTKSDAAVHVLEFLAGLSRLTDMSRSFHGEEIKVVFGVCFSYIEYVRGKRYDEVQQRTRSAVGSRHSTTPADPQPANVATEDVAQYVYALAYHVIIFWHLTLKYDDRKKYLPWMQQRLLSTDQFGNYEEHAVITLDLIWRTTRKDITTAALASPLPMPSDACSWITGYSLLTITCNREQGNAEITERRASGTDTWQISNPGRLGPEAIFREHFEGSIDGPFQSEDKVQYLPQSDATQRSITMIDRTSPVDFFKAGVMYIGENQRKEAVILSNIMGSPDYVKMAQSLGTRLELLGLNHNTAGLDTSAAQGDGSYTIWNREDVTALIYHITTIMPTDKIADPDCIRKKAHIGNDFVNIVFNNSGRAFEFDTFPSAFNYVYICVTPEARSTFIETRTRKHRSQQSYGRMDDSSWYDDAWFKVQVLTRADFPKISSASETKVVSGQVLAKYVRNLALNACVFCNVWAEAGSGEYPSSWRSRLLQLRNLRDRHGVEWQ